MPWIEHTVMKDDDDDMIEELLPCPFCGCSAKVVSKWSENWHYVVCETPLCGMIGPFDTPEYAKDRWNRRAEYGEDVTRERKAR